jgi:transmembrane sensor
MSSTRQQVDDQAARWAALRDLGLSPEQQEAFELWLKADKRHLGAYARAEGALIRVERTRGCLGKFPVAPKPSAFSRRRMILSGSMAAGFAAAGFFGFDLWKRSRHTTYSTGKGEVREILLADGSVVKLNTNSAVEVRYTETLRNIHLLRGEALFDVAKNKARPFVVQANDTLVRAVGTAFTVSMLPKKPVSVLVKEGVVEMKHATAAAAAPVRVHANNLAIAPDDAPITTAPIAEAKLARDLAWENGRLAFDDQTLQDAANEYARYSDIHIVVDPAVAAKTITGSFVSNDPVGFAKHAATLLDLQVEVNGREVKIFRRAYDTR